MNRNGSLCRFVLVELNVITFIRFCNDGVYKKTVPGDMGIANPLGFSPGFINPD
jgi:hypothetical protein